MSLQGERVEYLQGLAEVYRPEIGKLLMSKVLYLNILFEILIRPGGLGALSRN